MAKRNYVSPVILVLACDPGTSSLPLSQYDPDNPKTGNAKEFEFGDEEYDPDGEL